MARQMSLRYRIQEFLADRLSFVQYPNVRAGSKNSRLVMPFRFAESMTWYTRMALIAVGLFSMTFFGSLALIGLYLLKGFVSGMLDSIFRG